MQIHLEHLKFLAEAKAVFENEPRRATYRNENEDLIALCHRYDDDTIPSIEIYELGPQVAFFANILNTDILKEV